MIFTTLIPKNLSLLFFNAGQGEKSKRTDLRESVSRYLLEELLAVYEPSILALSEYQHLLDDNGQLLFRLNQIWEQYQRITVASNQHTKKSHKIALWRKSDVILPQTDSDINWNTDHYRYCHLIIEDGGIPLLFTFVHLPDMFQHQDIVTRSLFAQKVAQSIRFRRNNLTERYSRFVPSAIIGDFNMFPYDAGMTHRLGFNSSGIYENALAETLDFQGDAYDHYFNPMWTFLANYNYEYQSPDSLPAQLTIIPQKPVYSYHKSGKKAVIDQVLLNHAIFEQYNRPEIRIFVPPAGTSDHSPILLALKNS
jgi:hypothetical protein